MKKSEFIKALDAKPEIRKHIFEKGYLIVNKGKISESRLSNYPFYNNWNKTVIGDFDFFVYDSVDLFRYEHDGKTFFLIGHAYNPYTMESREEPILKEVADSYGAERYFDKIDELTGIFIMGVVEGDKIEFLLDASGMQYGCYGHVKNTICITSHMRLAGDVFGLKITDFANRLTHYKWYHYMMGSYLPGDITCFKELTRIIPNTYVKYDGLDFTVDRFYPRRSISMCSTDEEYRRVIEDSAKIMQNTMKLITEKWERPAISLTGGIDSNTTFAAANGLYDKYSTFSYISMYRESVDAEKAKEISERFNVTYKRYNVPDNNDELQDFRLYKLIFDWNDGGIGHYKDSDTRKKITLINNDVCDVEVKSWISETIRAYAYKYFGRTSFPKSLTPRNYTSLYKIFVADRKLVKETDNNLAEYLEHTNLKKHLYNDDESDFFVWEMMHGGKCGGDIGVMKSCFDITIPYNNRKLIDTLLRVPLEKRISDQHHLDLKKTMNEELYNMGIRVVNLNETKKRKTLANVYYTINSIVPF